MGAAGLGKQRPPWEAREAGRSSSNNSCDGEEPGNEHSKKGSMDTRVENARPLIASRDAETARMVDTLTLLSVTTHVLEH